MGCVFFYWRFVLLLKLNASASAKGHPLIDMVPPPTWSKKPSGWGKLSLLLIISVLTFFHFLFLIFLWVCIPWILYLLFLLPRAKPPVQTALLECSCLILHSTLKTELSPLRVMLTYDWNIQIWTPGIFHLLFICWADARRATAARNPAGQVLPVGVIEKQ